MNDVILTQPNRFYIISMKGSARVRDTLKIAERRYDWINFHLSDRVTPDGLYFDLYIDNPSEDTQCKEIQAYIIGVLDTFEALKINARLEVV